MKDDVIVKEDKMNDKSINLDLKIQIIKVECKLNKVNWFLNLKNLKDYKLL